MLNIIRNDIKQFTEKIETLVDDIKSILNNDDFFTVANEFVKNNLTFVFTLGKYYAFSKSNLNSTMVSKPRVNNYHNIRDSRGRFVRGKT